ncbi:hypothetical protein FQN60_009354 [Etheostoma spectabile]|uniref:Uncharacterized protein n=1 Tax=Etheostoma spectabile TaxID=54343 RepID=A0A5J5DJ04_9PERO|nr:hypothetical protein FQN60_009354 [Etheostoma spectabile]
MAAASARRTHRLCKTLAFGLLLMSSLLNAGVTEEDVVAAEEHIRGDMIPKATEAPALTEQTTAAAATPTATEEPGDNNDSGPEETADKKDGFTVEVHTNIDKIVEPVTPASMPARGDGGKNIPRPVPQEDVVCVSKEAVQDKNAVNLKLKASSNCKDSKMKIESVLQQLCGEDCKLDIYQEDNSDEVFVSGKYTDVEEAVPRWGKNSKLVLVSLLLTGLLLAALLVAGYYLKTHRKNSKGVRLAESFQVDEENQANTLVSVAPLPQEPLDKQTINVESPPENGTNPAPTTNGHSATQTPVADTEM